MAFRFIGGKCRVLRIPTHIYTESVFFPNANRTCITNHAHFRSGEKKRIQWIPVKDDKEGEWLSVCESILFGLENNETCINIEHTSEEVVNALLLPIKRKLKQPYNRYRNITLALAKETEWTAIRFFPANPMDACEIDAKSLYHSL
jgi:hypothetical protein